MGFEVSDIQAWEDYATRVLGLEVSERAEDGTVYLRMDEYHHRLALHPGGKDDLTYVGFLAANKEEFENIKSKLYESGVEFVQASKDEIANRHVVDMIRYDMSGIPAEVYWGGHVVFEKPFYPSQPMSGFRSGPLGLGHVGLNPDNGDEFIRILTGPLGFRDSDALGGPEVRFFHCNGREHSVVVGRGATANDPNPKRIQHFMLEMKALDDVGFCLNRVQEDGIEITSGFGKHTNDHMYSFYMKTPSGFRVEYGWNGRTVDDDDWVVNSYRSATVWRSKA